METSSLSWSPETCLSASQSALVFCSGGMDGVVRFYFLEDIKSGSSIQPTVLSAHKPGNISVACSPVDSSTIASCGSDFSCVVWDLKKEAPKFTLPLTSPGVRCIFHDSEPMQVMVADQQGRCALYDLRVQAPCAVFRPYSLGYSMTTLSSIDWSSQDGLIALAAEKSCTIWDVKNSSQPVVSETLSESIGHVRFSQIAEGRYALASVNNLVVGQIGHTGRQWMEHQIEEIGGISWYKNMLCSGGYKRICLWPQGW